MNAKCTSILWNRFGAGWGMPMEPPPTKHQKSIITLWFFGVNFRMVSDSNVASLDGQAWTGQLTFGTGIILPAYSIGFSGAPFGALTREERKWAIGPFVTWWAMSEADLQNRSPSEIGNPHCGAVGGEKTVNLNFQAAYMRLELGIQFGTWGDHGNQEQSGSMYENRTRWPRCGSLYFYFELKF